MTTSYGPFTGADVASILAFVQAGGGLITGGQSWYWASENPTSDLTQYPGTDTAEQQRNAPVAVRMP